VRVRSEVYDQSYGRQALNALTENASPHFTHSLKSALVLVRLDHVASFIVNAKEPAVLSDAVAAEIKTERESPRTRAPMSLVLPMRKRLSSLEDGHFYS
jgi:hypothetical protein